MTSPSNTWQPTNRSLRSVAVLLSCAVVVCTSLEAGAISTVSPRFDPPKIASGDSQSVMLLLTYFPGNGEAVTEARVHPPRGATIVSVMSTIGQADYANEQITLNYLKNPVGTTRVDTVRVSLAVEQTGDLPWGATLTTTLDTDSQAKHQTQWSLHVVQPLQVRWSVSPDQWYVGEKVDLQIRLANQDSRVIDHFELAWPPGVSGARVSQKPVSVPGTQAGKATLQYTGRVLGGAPSQESWLRAVISADGLRNQALASLPITIASVPQLQVIPKMDLQRGRPGKVKCVWSLEGDAQLTATDLRFSVEGISSIDVEGAQVTFDAQTGRAEVWVTNTRLDAENPVEILLQLTAKRTGPLAFRPSVTPQGRTMPIPIAQTAVVPVLEQGDPGTYSAQLLTDLELARKGLVASWAQALRDLPIDTGTLVRVHAEGRHDANWMVEEAVTQALLLRGDRLPMDDESSMYELRFQVASSQATYEPHGSIWNPMSSGHRRKTTVNAQARLVDSEGQILWARRVEARSADEVGSDAAAQLGGADAVDQSIVPPNQRPLEVGLSGLIVGALFFVFFSP